MSEQACLVPSGGEALHFGHLAIDLHTGDGATRVDKVHDDEFPRHLRLRDGAPCLIREQGAKLSRLIGWFGAGMTRVTWLPETNKLMSRDQHRDERVEQL